MQTSKAFLQKFKAGGQKWLDRIITTDETWLHYFDPKTKRVSVCGTGVLHHQRKQRFSKSIGKQMYIFLLISTGWFLLTLYPPVRQWMCHTILQLTFYKQYAIFNYLYNNKSTCVFHWILQFKTYCKFMIW